ncbi:hypothetical protein Cantr_06855 [Candida viswanathii]|uniref:Uncharacterized protein n=1 Tax=Candida viswanathii TaxID=5486 RepID=A0A367XUQ7_9ASCO|nr:hypothetical protein Cantr_06855 [Candida viswanathii]
MDAKEDERSMTHMYNMDISSPNNMFVKSTSYFLDAVAKKRDLLNYASSPDFQDSHIAKELTVSGILIFAYLGVDPNRMVPLIDFTRQSTDFIQISRGVRHTIVTCAPIIYQSDIKGALLLKGIDDLKSPKFKLCKYPIIASLREELENLVTDEISSNSSHEYSVLRETIHTLMHAIYGCKFYKLPVPLFRFMMKIPDEFRELLYQRNEFSLRLLFRYASLNAISGFYFHERRNMWKDHMIWYAQLYKLSKIDKQLYYLAVEKNFIWEDSARFYEFDPAVEYDRLRNSQTT